MTSHNMIHLAQGKATCAVAPASGGAIMALDLDGIAVLRRAGGDDVLDSACFPLVPFANRIAHGNIAFGEGNRRAAIDEVGFPHAIHGNGWRRQWHVDDTGADYARLSIREPAGDWPWPYHAWQMITLEENRLTVELGVQNLHPVEAMPAGFGLHPYFPRAVNSTITAHAPVMWFNDITGLARSPQETGLFSGAAVGIDAVEGLDNFFVSPNPEIVIDGGGATITLSAPGAGFHLFAPGDHDYFCVEPVSHTPNSFGRGEFADTDILAPMQSRSQTYRFDFHI